MVKTCKTVLFTLLSLIILFDYLGTGNIVSSEIINVKRDLQRHYNASGNFHYSYRLVTLDHTFSVDKSDYRTLKLGDSIEYSISPIFKKINWYKPFQFDRKKVYSLRWMSALLLPVMLLISMLLEYLLKSRIEIDLFVFILQVVLLASLGVLVFT
tara:strand:+ start:129 stop:593 length:465 start_codon:yes stop_codon:yes gene_type:complete